MLHIHSTLLKLQPNETLQKINIKKKKIKQRKETSLSSDVYTHTYYIQPCVTAELMNCLQI